MDSYANYIALVLGNFGLVMFILATVIALFHKIFWWRTLSLSEIIYRWFSLLPLGITSLYLFGMHMFYPGYIAAILGWANSPFQFEVAIANLAFGLIAIISFRASYGFRLATVIGTTCWLWGNALTSIYQMAMNNHFVFDVAGPWCWLDILVPLLLILSLKRIHRPNP